MKMFIISLIESLRRQPKGPKPLLGLFVMFLVSSRGSDQHLLEIMGTEVLCPGVK